MKVFQQGERTISAGRAPPLISSRMRRQRLLSSWIAEAFVANQSWRACRGSSPAAAEWIKSNIWCPRLTAATDIWRARPLMPGAISMGIARESSSEVRMELLSSRLTTICTAAPLLFFERAAGRAGFIPHGCCAWRVCGEIGRHFRREVVGGVAVCFGEREWGCLGK